MMSLTGRPQDQSGLRKEHRYDGLTSSATYQLETYLTSENEELNQHIAEQDFRSIMNLSRQELKDQDMAIVLKKAMFEKKCRYLHLWHNQFTKKSMPILAQALRRTKTVKELDLSWNRIGNNGAKILAEALSSPYCVLQELDLTKTQIDDRGATYLAAMLPQNLHLKRLILNKNLIGKEGLDAFAQHLNHRNTRLEVLRLENNYKIQEEDIEQFITDIDREGRRLNTSEIYLMGCGAEPALRDPNVIVCCNGSVRVFYSHAE